jgi:two-component system response regulator AtoC
MPRLDGLGLLRALREAGSEAPVVVLTAHGTVESAVEAMKLGAVDYILRPFEMSTVELAVTRALAQGEVRRENRFLRDEVGRGWGELIGRGEAMHRLFGLIRQVAPARSSVLIVGETGTGKELVARAVHRESGRAGLFVPFNCAAIPAELLESELFGIRKGAFTGADRDRVGRFEASSGGTVFLDEITEMPLELQGKLLRVLQEGTVERLGTHAPIELDLRVVAATNRDPMQAVDEGRLRADLYYRLTSFAWRCRRCASAARTSRCWPSTFSSASAANWAARPCGSTPPPLPGSSATTGPATFGSCRT